MSTAVLVKLGCFSSVDRAVPRANLLSSRTIHAGASKPTYAECNIDSSATTDDLLGTVKNIINVILGVLGVVAVVVIILGGFTFMTSQGDAGKVMKGRNTILWVLFTHCGAFGVRDRELCVEECGGLAVLETQNMDSKKAAVGQVTRYHLMALNRADNIV